jgi:magnesium-transporting ATPase (P-type)
MWCCLWYCVLCCVGCWRQAVLPLLDPLHADTKAAMDAARAYGVEVKVLTGDHTAIAVETCRALGLGTRVRGTHSHVHACACVYAFVRVYLHLCAIECECACLCVAMRVRMFASLCTVRVDCLLGSAFMHVCVPVRMLFCLRVSLCVSVCACLWSSAACVPSGAGSGGAVV